MDEKVKAHKKSYRPRKTPPAHRGVTVKAKSDDISREPTVDVSPTIKPIVLVSFFSALGTGTFQET